MSAGTANSNELLRLLSGGDLRDLSASSKAIYRITNQTSFDALFNYLFCDDRLVVMRAADVIEKITAVTPQYLGKHKPALLALAHKAQNKELCWHIAQLLPRLALNAKEAARVRVVLTTWVKDKQNSRIVRVNALQALSDLVKQGRVRPDEFRLIMSEIERENIPSLNARIKKLRQQC